MSSEDESEESDTDSRPSSKKKEKKPNRRKRYDSDKDSYSEESDDDDKYRERVAVKGKKKVRIDSEESGSEETMDESKAKQKKKPKVIQSESGSESDLEEGQVLDKDDVEDGDGNEDGSETEVSEGDWEEIDINSGSDKGERMKSPKQGSSSPQKLNTSELRRDASQKTVGSPSKKASKVLQKMISPGETSEELETGDDGENNVEAGKNLRKPMPGGKNVRKRKSTDTSIDESKSFESKYQQEIEDTSTKSDECTEKDMERTSRIHPIFECSVSLETLSDNILQADSIHKGDIQMEPSPDKEMQDSASDSSPIKKKRTRRTKAQMEAARKIEEEMIEQLIADGVSPEIARKKICGKKSRSRSFEQLQISATDAVTSDQVNDNTEENSEVQTNVGEIEKTGSEVVIKKEPERTAETKIDERKNESPLSARRDYNNAPVGIVKPEVRQGVIVENRQVMDSMRGPVGPGGRPHVGSMVSPLQGMKDMTMGKISDQGGFSPPNMPPGYQNRGNTEGFRQPNYPAYPSQQGPFGPPQQSYQQGIPHRPYSHTDEQGPMSPGSYPPASQYGSPNMPPGSQGYYPGSFRSALEGPQSPPAGFGGYGPVGGQNYPHQGPYSQGFHSPTGPYQGQLQGAGPYPEPQGAHQGPHPGSSAQMNYPPNMPSGYPQIPQPRHPPPHGMHYPQAVQPVSPNQPVRPQPYPATHAGPPKSDSPSVRPPMAGVPPRSRRGFMMDNILKPTSTGIKEEENVDEINDIVNYVANDEYFKEH